MAREHDGQTVRDRALDGSYSAAALASDSDLFLVLIDREPAANAVSRVSMLRDDALGRRAMATCSSTRTGTKGGATSSRAEARAARRWDPSTVRSRDQPVQPTQGSAPAPRRNTGVTLLPAIHTVQMPHTD